MKSKLKFIYILISVIFINSPSFTSEKNKGLNFYTGMFDFSDDGKKASLYGVEHQNENLFRDTIFGRITPVTGCKVPKEVSRYKSSFIC